MQERLYAATLTVIGRLQPQGDGRHFTVTTPDGGEFTVKMRGFKRRNLKPEQIDVPLELHIWPRTDREGRLQPGSQLYKLRPAEAPRNHLSVTGRLIYYEPNEPRVAVLIRRNQQGNLLNEFAVSARVAGSAVAAMPRPLPWNVQPVRGVALTGHLEGDRLVVTGVEHVNLAEAKPLKKRRRRPKHLRPPRERKPGAAAATTEAAGA